MDWVFILGNFLNWVREQTVIWILCVFLKGEGVGNNIIIVMTINKFKKEKKI